MADITTIILTLNEEMNIAGAIESVQPFSKRIIVIDSFSNDNTTVIAKEYGVEVIEHEFINQAQQFNYALGKLDITTKWILRIDADERVPEKAAIEIEDLCKKYADTNINGIVVRFSVTFLGRTLRHGGIYPIRVLRLFKYGIGYIEERSVDEHTRLRYGKCVEMKNDLEHHDNKSLNVWINKHNKYSENEMEEYYRAYIADESHIVQLNARLKRFIKNNVYYRLPIGFRAHLYFWYRYYFLLGFLDGTPGKIFCFLQAYWYRFLVDAKIYERGLKQ